MAIITPGAAPLPRKDVSKMSDQSPATILIVDDDQEVLMLLEEYVSLVGDFKIVLISSGIEALEKVETIAPDLILLDIMMEGMEGTEVCRLLKSNEKTAHIPVIAATVIQKIHQVRYEEIMDSGVDDYVEKPFEFAVLKEVIRKHLYHQDSEE